MKTFKQYLNELLIPKGGVSRYIPTGKGRIGKTIAKVRKAGLNVAANLNPHNSERFYQRYPKAGPVVSSTMAGAAAGAGLAALGSIPGPNTLSSFGQHPSLAVAIPAIIGTGLTVLGNRKNKKYSNENI